MTTPTAPQRMVGPDLARGITLLGIALANSVTCWAMVDSRPTSVGVVRPDNIFDSIAVVISTIGVHVRGLPMFATLLGYGVGLIYARSAREGLTLSGARKVLVRRYLFLGLFGAVHMALIFWGDIMLMYALLVLILTTMVSLSDRALLWIAGGMAAIGAPIACFFFYLSYAEGFLHPAHFSPFLPFDQYTDQLAFGSIGMLAIPFNMLPLAPVILPVIILGFLAGRRNALAQPELFRKPMVIAMVVSAVIALGVGIPWAWSILTDNGQDLMWFAINGSLGFYTGPGAVAAFFYVGSKLSKTKWVSIPPLSWVVALGRMSMSGYVLQSVVFNIIMSPWGFGIGSQGPISQVLVVAFFVWLITVVLAGLWPQQRGPLETIHRKQSYPAKKQQSVVPAPGVQPAT